MNFPAPLCLIGKKDFSAIVGILMDTNCAILLADIFLYGFEAEFSQGLFNTSKKHLAQRFNFTCRYKDDVFFL